MGEDRLEKFIKNQVAGHQTPTDTDKLWEGILAKQEIEEKPKRRFFFWFWLSAGILLLSGALSYGIVSALSDEEPIAKVEDIQKETSSTISTSSKTTDSESQNTTESETATDAINSNTAKSKNTTSVKNGESIQNNKNNNTPTIASNTTDVSNSNNATTNRNTAPTTTSGNAAQQNALTIAQKQEENIASILPSVASENEAKTTNDTPELLQSFASSINQLDVNTLLAKIKMDPMMAAFDQNELPEFQKAAATTPRFYPSPFSIGIYGGYGLAAHQLNTNNNSDEAYLALREKTETAEQILTAGLDIQYQFEKRLYLKSGLGYQQITERFDFTNVTESDIELLETPTSVYKRSDGSIDTTLGTIIARKVVIQGRRIFNRYRMIDLPLLIGYQAPSKNRLAWFAEAGVLVNLAFAPDGEIIDTDGQSIVDLSASDDFRNTVGLTFSGAIGLSYRLTKNISLQVSPRLRYGLGSVTNSEAALSQQFWSGALETGIRYRF